MHRLLRRILCRIESEAKANASLKEEVLRTLETHGFWLRSIDSLFIVSPLRFTLTANKVSHLREIQV
jgi:hypothetical protein